MINLSFSVDAQAESANLISDFCDCKRVRLNEEIVFQNESSLISNFSFLPSDLVFDQFAAFNMQSVNDEMLELIDSQLEENSKNSSLSKVVKVSAQGTALIIGSITNLLVIATIFKQRRTIPPSSIFIINLAIADLLLLFHLPITMDMTLNDNAFRFGKTFCFLDVALKTAVMHLTVFLLCMMAFDRYIKIGYNSFVIKTSKKKYMAIAAFLWLLSFAFAIPNISLFEYNKNRQSCNVDWSSGSLESRIEDSLAALKIAESDLSQLEDTLKRNCSTMEMEECDFSNSVKLEKESVCPTYSLKFKTYVIFAFSTGFLLPGLIMSLSYLKLWQSVENVRTNLRDLSSASSSSDLGNLLVLLQLSYIVCWFPSQLFHVLRSFDLLRNFQCESMERWLQLLAWLNPVLNPLLYCFFGSRFRHDFRAMILGCFGREIDPRTSSRTRFPLGSRTSEGRSFNTQRSFNTTSSMVNRGSITSQTDSIYKNVST